MRVSRGVAAICCLALAACSAPRPEPAPAPASERVVGYLTDWGVYGRNYQVKDVETSGAAKRLTHLVYAFGKVTDGRCAAGDDWADFRRPIAAGGRDSSATAITVTGSGRVRRPI